MTNHRHPVPISRKLFSFIEKQEEVGELPCQSFPDLFFPDQKGYGQSQDIASAKELCKACPLIEDCRDYAIEAKEPYGIWGGLTVDERRTYRTISVAVASLGLSE
jgi:WhiB family redox-sensing transcriptional regulator